MVFGGRYRLRSTGGAPERGGGVAAQATSWCWRSSAGLFVLEAVSVIVQVASFKLDRLARVPDGAAAPPFREEGLGKGAQIHRHPLLDHRDGAPAPQSASRRVEAAMTGLSVYAGRKVGVGPAP